MEDEIKEPTASDTIESVADTQATGTDTGAEVGETAGSESVPISSDTTGTDVDAQV